MIAPADIERLVAAARQSGIVELEIVEGSSSLRFRLGRAPSPGGTPPRTNTPRRGTPRESRFIQIGSPGVGIFRTAHPVTGRTLARRSDHVSTGDIVAFLQVGPALRAVLADGEGVLSEPLLSDGTAVGYGTPLFHLE